MNFKNIKNFKVEKKDFDFKKIKDFLWDFLLNKFGAIFMSIFLIAGIIGGFIIYKYIYNSEWSDVQKKEYRLQVEKNKIPFDLNKFNNIIKRINERKKLNNNIVISKDIFKVME